jgi:hypothetical protein
MCIGRPANLGYTTAVIRVRFLAGEADFLFLHSVHIDASGHPPSYLMEEEDMLPGGKAARFEADH